MLKFPRNEVSGLTQKSFAILHKTAVIYCAAREAMAVMEKGEAIDNEEPTAKFEVAASDVDAGWDLVMLSFEAQKNFKVNIVLVPCLTDVLCFYVRWQSEKNLRRRLRRRRLQEDYWMTRKLQRTLSGLGSRRLKLSMIESMKMMK